MVGFSELSMYRTSKGVDKRFLTKQSLKHAVFFLIKNYFFTIRNLCINKTLTFQWE